MPGPSGRSPVATQLFPPLKGSDSSSSLFSEFSDTSSTVSSMTPVSAERTDLLLRFFRSDFFDEWIAISYLHTCHQDGVCDYLCNRLYGLPVERWERYLAQLCVILVMRPLPALERFIVDSCADCVRIAVKVYWLLTAWMADKSERDPQYVILKRVRALCLESALNGGWEPPFKEHLISSHRAASALSRQGSRGLLGEGAGAGGLELGSGGTSPSEGAEEDDSEEEEESQPGGGPGGRGGGGGGAPAPPPPPGGGGGGVLGQGF